MAGDYKCHDGVVCWNYFCAWLCLLSFELNWLIILGCFFRVPFLAKMRAAPIMSRFNFLVAELSPIYLSLDLRFKGGTPIPELFSLFTVLRYARLSPAFFRSSSSSRNICIFLICCLSCGECLNRLMIVWRAMRRSWSGKLSSPSASQQS